MSKIKAKNVRLSFPSLFRTAQFGDEDTGKYEATFVFDKVEHAEIIKSIQAQINKLMKEELKTKLGDDKLCLKDGDEIGRPEFEGKMTLKASTKKRPVVIDRDRAPLAEADNKPYAGCYVNMIVSIWPQDNRYGKRVNAQLDGVQFYADGEPFGDAGITADEFDEYDAFDPVDEF
jgi:hypothetical protein